jgi:negative regulator of flagellin synthesis FlgM
MKIGPIDIKSAPVATKSAPNADRKSDPKAEPSTTVDFSAAASLLAGGAADPTFDAGKVERITQAIRDGKYHVDAEAIADKLLSNAEEFLGPKSN